GDGAAQELVRRRGQEVGVGDARCLICPVALAVRAVTHCAHARVELPPVLHVMARWGRFALRAEREAGDEGTEQTRDAEPSPGPVRVDAHGGGRGRGGPGKHPFAPRALREGLGGGVGARAPLGHHAFMMPALRSDAVTKVLRRLRAAGEAEDGPAKLRVRTRESELGQKIYGRERADLYGRAPIAITEEVGE